MSSLLVTSLVVFELELVPLRGKAALLVVLLREPARWKPWVIGAVWAVAASFPAYSPREWARALDVVSMRLAES